MFAIVHYISRQYGDDTKMISLKAVLGICFVGSIFGSGSAEDQAYPILKPAPEEVLFRVSEPFLLECVTQYPDGQTTFKWHKNDQPLKDVNTVQRPNEGSLVFLKPTPETAGRYQCFASTVYGTASTRVINVNQAYIKNKTPVIQYVKAVEGKPLKLNCDASNSYPKPEISWRLTSIFDPLISTEVSDVRMTFAPEGTLYITSVEKEDANKNFKYVCLARTPASPNNDVPIAEYVIQEVTPNKGESEIVELYTSKDMTVKVGDRVFIHCIFGGNPLPMQDYYKDGEDSNGMPKSRVTPYNRSKGKRLLIRDTWLTDAGTYLCVSHNNVSASKEHSMKLNVVAAPHPELIPSGEVKATGEKVTIPCNATGVPAPKISWTFNSKPISSSEHIKIVTSTAGNSTTSELSIVGLKQSDTGYYGCIVENEHGGLYGEVLYVFDGQSPKQ
ncbi:hemolin-like [Pieris napi]|uniref:hemolin-like n=1 Tax=Pieris napi TaxID=78633 RepID=UPI001FB972F7|nr:hemolin-like [Pieris napi]